MKGLYRKIAGRPGIAGLLRHVKRGPTILFYHGVEERIIDPQVQAIHLELRAFERQVSYLQKHYQIVSLDDLCESMDRGRNLDPSHVVLTFDDGYRNNLQTVAPYLNALGIPFAVFVSTAHIDEGKRFPTYVLRAAIRHCDERQIRVLGSLMDVSDDRAKLQTTKAVSKRLKSAPYATVDRILNELRGILSQERWQELDSLYSSDAPMTWEEVRELTRLGATIGSHCHEHFILHEDQDQAETEYQLRASKERIESQVGECRYIAYPNGGVNDISDYALERVEESGYRVGLTTVRGEVHGAAGRYLLPRIAADSNDLDRFKFDLNGAFRHNRDYRRWACD